jgi:hypothetical protein
VQGIRYRVRIGARHWALGTGKNKEKAKHPASSLASGFEKSTPDKTQDMERDVISNIEFRSSNLKKIKAL